MLDMRLSMYMVDVSSPIVPMRLLDAQQSSSEKKLDIAFSHERVVDINAMGLCAMYTTSFSRKRQSVDFI